MKKFVVVFVFEIFVLIVATTAMLYVICNISQKLRIIKMKKIIPIFVILLFHLGCKTNQNEIKNENVQKSLIKNEFPKQLGYVSDYDKILKDSEINKLSKILEDYDNKTTMSLLLP